MHTSRRACLEIVGHQHCGISQTKVIASFLVELNLLIFRQTSESLG